VSLEAEEALLGSLLLSGDAIEHAERDVGAEDFYSAAHSYIYLATTRLSREERQSTTSQGPSSSASTG
jgi:replicative DNA helicase